MMEYTNSFEMKICFVYELMRSIACDFSEKSALQERKDLAVLMTKQVIRENKRRISHVKKHTKDEKIYGNLAELKDAERKLKRLLKFIVHFDAGHQDGRYFRDIFPEGYRGMLEYFDIEKETN